MSLQRKIEGRHDANTGMPTSAEKREIARSISRAVLERWPLIDLQKVDAEEPAIFETAAYVSATSSEMPEVVSQSTKGSEWPDEILEQERILREAEEALNRGEGYGKGDVVLEQSRSRGYGRTATSSSHSERGIYDGMDLSRLAEVTARDSSPSSPDSAHSAQDFINNFKETVMANVRASLSPLKTDAVSSANAVLSDGKQIDSESRNEKKRRRRRRSTMITIKMALMLKKLCRTAGCTSVAVSRIEDDEHLARHRHRRHRHHHHHPRRQRHRRHRSRKDGGRKALLDREGRKEAEKEVKTAAPGIVSTADTGVEGAHFIRPHHLLAVIARVKRASL